MNLLQRIPRFYVREIALSLHIPHHLLGWIFQGVITKCNRPLSPTILKFSLEGMNRPFQLKRGWLHNHSLLHYMTYL